MIITFDKALDPHIQSVTSGLVTGSIYYFQTETSAGWVIDTESFNIRVGADDTTISFDTLASMTPYIEQMTSMTGMQNPAVDGINEDPFYDKIPPSGSIQSHTYINTDIEQDLINGDV